MYITTSDGADTTAGVVTMEATMAGAVITEACTTRIGDHLIMDGDGEAHTGAVDTTAVSTVLITDMDHTMVTAIILTTDLVIQEVTPILIPEEGITEEQLPRSIDMKEPLAVQMGTLEHQEDILDLQIVMATIKVKELQLDEVVDIQTHPELE